MPRRKRLDYEVIELFPNRMLWQFVIVKTKGGKVIERFLIEPNDDENPSLARIRAMTKCEELNANTIEATK